MSAERDSGNHRHYSPMGYSALRCTFPRAPSPGRGVQRDPKSLYLNRRHCRVPKSKRSELPAESRGVVQGITRRKIDDGMSGNLDKGRPSSSCLEMGARLFSPKSAACSKPVVAQSSNMILLQRRRDILHRAYAIVTVCPPMGHTFSRIHVRDGAGRAFGLPSPSHQQG